MQRKSPQEAVEPPTPSPRLSRTYSKSDRPPITSFNTLPAPPHITPEPAYIAASAAAHVVSSGLANRGRAFATDEELEEETAASVSPSALVLLNNFLDQLLYSFLASSRSTSILSLKPAIAEILKPRLAKEAIDGADEELRGYMAGGDDEELLDFHNGQELKGGSSLHHIFRRTRLRCMVYTRLGDLEEDDEEAYLENESPERGGQNRLSRDFGNVSPAAAIFLTSIIEFIGEQALIVAGENSVSRLGSSKQAGGDRISVEDHDVEKIAFNKTLGRLWRSWKKASRTASMISPRPPLYELNAQRKTVSEGASRATSISTTSEQGYFLDRMRRQDSIDEHEVKPGRKIPPTLSDLPDEPEFGPDENYVPDRIVKVDRPRSMIDFKFPTEKDLEDKIRRNGGGSDRQPLRSENEGGKSHRRASSLPAAKITPYSSPTEDTFSTPTEEPPTSARDKNDLSVVDSDIDQIDGEADKVAELAHKRGISNVSDGVMKRNTKPIPIDPSLSTRELSISDYSDQSSMVNDAEMTPQALSFKKTPVKGHQDSFYDELSSTKTSSYSFHAGQQSPRASSNVPSEQIASTDDDDDDESGVFPTRAVDKVRIKKDDFSKLASVNGEPLKTYDDSGKNVKRDIPVLYEAAANEDVVYVPKHSPQPKTQATMNDSNDIGYGDPQAFEAVENQSQLGAAHRVDLRKLPTSAPTSAPSTSPGTERAAVQRIQHKARVSSGSNRDVRPVTAQSTASSKIKGIMHRDSGDAVRQAVPRTTSSDLTRETTGGSSLSGRSADKGQDFEKLIRSDETIQYTLTPQNMRDIEVCGLPLSSIWANPPP